MNTNNAKMIRTGDVLYVKVSDEAVKPEGAKKHAPWTAEGEATGHYHRVNGPQVEVVTTDTQMWVVAPEGAELTHEDHDTVILDPGTWIVIRQKEFNPFAETELERVRIVRD